MDPLEAYLTRVAEEGIAMLGDVPTRSGCRRVIDPTRIKAAVVPSTRSGGDADTLFYVVNFADSAGFALIDADTTSKSPLYAVTEKGNYTPGEVTNSGFDDYVMLLDSRDLGLPNLKNPDSTLMLTASHEYYTDWEVVEPLLEVRWGQDWPYNQLTPLVGDHHTLAGCIATAMAQVMSYYESPDSIELFYNPIYIENENDDIDTLYDVFYPSWKDLKKHNNIVPNSCAQCKIAHNQLPYLFRELGHRVDMNYSLNGSGAYIDAVYEGLQELGYSLDALQSYDWLKIVSSLDSGLLVYAGGYPGKEGMGHAWVIDGYKTRKFIRVTEYLNPFGPTPIPDIEETEYRYVHVNWGWNGSNNGYFTSGVFNTVIPYELDANSSILYGYDFSYAVKMYTKIETINK